MLGTGKLLARLVALSALLAYHPSLAWSDDSCVWPVKERLFGKHGARSENVSGIACTSERGFPRSCLVIDDELQAAQLVTVKDGELRARDPIPLIDNQYDDEPLELDGEGVAYADGAFYVIGSHSHPRDKNKKLDSVADAGKIKAKISANSQLIRIRLKPALDQPISLGDIADVRRSSKLREIIAAEPLLKRFLDRRLENNGLTIEGVAVLRSRLYAGFRGPTLENGRTLVLSVSLEALFEGGSAQTHLHLLALGDSRGVRDLAPFDGGLLILVGPAGAEDGRYQIYWWDAASENIRHLADITKAVGADEHRKPEAILPLDRGPSGVRVLILLDGGEEGEPCAVVIPSP